MATLCTRLNRRNAKGTYDVIYFETGSDNVKRPSGGTVEDTLVSLGTMTDAQLHHASRHFIDGEDVITPADIGAATDDHTHNYAGSQSVGGSADSAVKLDNAKTILVDLTSTTATGFNGTANVTPGVSGILPTAHGGTGNANGTVAKLTTARTIQTNLGITTAVNFDGSANITPGVTGTLPIANGGTGNTTGLAASATKLATGRDIQTDLGSTTAATFDGTDDIAPGVTGVLPIANGGTGNTTGLAASATKLATARTVLVSLASTSSASFNGTANITPGVSGILPVANGGTGNANGTVAKLTTARSIQTNLGSTTAASFDGSANITPGVTGTLPVTNGGTGNTSGTAPYATQLATGRTIQTNLGSTSAATFNGTANITPGITGTLGTAHGGTGTTDGTAPYATQLKTSRSIGLSGDVTGSASFNGAANATISATLASSGVTAGTYGPFANGFCWVPNNRGVASQSATWTLTAKKAGTFRFFWSAGSEEGYDYLTVTIAGTQVVSTYNTVSPNGGFIEKSIASGNAIVFTWKEDGSNFYDQDYCCISGLALFTTNSNFEMIHPGNIDTYFTVSNGTYTFKPAFAFTPWYMNVDAKGRVTKSQNMYPTLFKWDDWKKYGVGIISGGVQPVNQQEGDLWFQNI